MKFNKIMILAVASLLIGSAMTLSATPVVSQGETTVMGSDDDSKSEKKDKKKKEKKKKKDKEVKTPEEVLALIKAIEWKKPEKSGLEIDTYYNDADEFFKLIKDVDNSVSLFKVCKAVSPNGQSIIAPVDIRTGQIRHKNEAFAQVAEASLFATNLALMSTTLAAGAVTHAIQIGQDAIPFVGDPARKAANVNIAKAVKIFPLLKNLIDTQNGMMKRYFKQNENVETTDSVSEALAVGEIDFNELSEYPMSDEDLEKYIKDEEGV